VATTIEKECRKSLGETVKKQTADLSQPRLLFNYSDTL
jgi:hypothetical protein